MLLRTTFMGISCTLPQCLRILISGDPWNHSQMLAHITYFSRLLIFVISLVLRWGLPSRHLHLLPPLTDWHMKNIKGFILFVCLCLCLLQVPVQCQIEMFTRLLVGLHCMADENALAVFFFVFFFCLCLVFSINTLERS